MTIMTNSFANTAAAFSLRSSFGRPGRHVRSAFGRKMGKAPFPMRAFSEPTTPPTTPPPVRVSDRGGVIIAGYNASSKIHLPPADDPVGLGLYKKAMFCPISRVLRTSMHVGSTNTNEKADGIVGDSVTPEEARIHARNSGLRLLATLNDVLDGELHRVEQVLHLRGMVKADASFKGHGGVIDGCSEVLAEAFGPNAGVGTRECFGVGSLGATVACTLEVRVAPPK